MTAQADFFNFVPADTLTHTRRYTLESIEADWLRRWCQDVDAFGDWLENRIHDWSWT